VEERGPFFFLNLWLVVTLIQIEDNII